MNKVVVVIPARYASQRLPGKPLRKIGRKSLIRLVCQRAAKIRSAREIIVATDDSRIASEVQSFGGRVVMTDADLPSGSDRVGAAVRELDFDIVVNLQGDEPIVDTAAIDQTIQYLRENDEVRFATLGFPLSARADYENPNIVKVLVDKFSRAIYFSRAPIPYFRDAEFRQTTVLLQHIGVYIFKKSALLQFLQWPPAPLEQVEKLEQLRILHQGEKIYVHPAKFKSAGVDVEADIIELESLLKKEGEF